MIRHMMMVKWIWKLVCTLRTTIMKLITSLRRRNIGIYKAAHRFFGFNSPANEPYFF